MPSRKVAAPLPMHRCASAEAFRLWLHTEHARAPGIWLLIPKKGASTAGPTYAEALDVALCYGWIDGQKKPHDDASWLQKFTPRRARSGWSSRNTEHAERLIRAGKMQPAGLREVEAAKADGRWLAAYAPPSTSEVPEDFLAALRQHKKAWAFFETLNKANRYAITYRLTTAKKPETRQKRFDQLLAMMKRGEKIH